MDQVTFVYKSYRVNSDKELHFYYEYIDARQQVIGEFCERYTLPIQINPEDKITQYILQQLHIVIGTSYYKSLLGEVNLSYQLNQAEADYWNAVYENGFGEYSFINKIESAIRPFQVATQQARSPVTLKNQGAILGIGGGKDSIVAGEICKHLSIDTHTMDIATRDNHGQADAVMDLMDLPQLRVERYLDTAIVDFTKQYSGNNGHIPFSSILVWIGILLAYSSDKRYVMMANEAATSSGNLSWNSREINHQWAKSAAFEELTLQFIHSVISPDLFYFSPIRPYGSLMVMALFSKLGQPYLQDFTSCNLVLRIDPKMRPNGRWCTQCAKCLSTWLLLTPWLNISQLELIFDRNLFQDESLRPLLLELLGLQGHKPLDCVGTTEELRAVTRKALQSYAHEPLLQKLNPADIPGPDIDSLIHTISASNIPPELEEKIHQFVAETV